MKIERLARQVEIKAVSMIESDGFGYFSGYAAVFNNVDLVEDIILTGAFAGSIAEKNSKPLYWQHRSLDHIGTVTCMEDTYGLKVEGRINLGVSTGKDVYALLKAGDVNAMSIGFYVEEFSYDETKDVRTLAKINLREVSLVSDPANPKALISSVKSLEEVRNVNSLADIEALLKENNFSSKSAKALISKVKEFSAVREVPAKVEEASRDGSVSMNALIKSINDTTVKLLTA